MLNKSQDKYQEEINSKLQEECDANFNEVLRRMLSTPPKTQKPKKKAKKSDK